MSSDFPLGRAQNYGRRRRFKLPDLGSTIRLFSSFDRFRIQGSLQPPHHRAPQCALVASSLPDGEKRTPTSKVTIPHPQFRSSSAPTQSPLLSIRRRPSWPNLYSASWIHDATGLRQIKRALAKPAAIIDLLPSEAPHFFLGDRPKKSKIGIVCAQYQRSAPTPTALVPAFFRSKGS